MDSVTPTKMTERRAEFKRRRAVGEAFSEQDGKLERALDLAVGGDTTAARAIADDLETWILGGDA